jgi:hypothetical protein
VDNVRLGRKLGIGTRVVAKMLRDRKPNVNYDEQNAPLKPTSRGSAEKSKPIDTRTAARNLTRGAVRGSQGFWKPFARIAHALWHEITGVFFALFALFFIQSAWRLHGSWRSGSQHGRFAIYLVLALVFAYFSVTAFVTSRRHKH